MKEEWIQVVIRAVREVINHPGGGRIDIFVNRQDRGEVRIAVNPSLVGITRRTVFAQVEDD